MCSQERPLCLNRPLNKEPIQFECDGTTEYTPIKELNKLLDYAKDENNMKPDVRSQGITKQCYKFDLAWLTVIQDIIRRFGIIKQSKFENDKINEQMTTEMIDKINNARENINLIELFENILMVGREKWKSVINLEENEEENEEENAEEKWKNAEQQCDDNKIDADCLAITIINEYQKLLKSDAFIEFCKKFKTRKFTPEEIKKVTAVLSNATNIEKEEVLGPIESLFTLTLPIMNSSGDLTNSLEEISVHDIKTKFKNIEELFKNENEKNGGKKKSKKKKSKKGKSKKGKSKKGKSKRKQSGGLRWNRTAAELFVNVLDFIIVWGTGGIVGILQLFFRKKHAKLRNSAINYLTGDK
jgi:hypothetical protein